VPAYRARMGYPSHAPSRHNGRKLTLAAIEVLTP
jgi:hypothetical protein